MFSVRLNLFLANLFCFLNSLHKSSNQGFGMPVLFLVLHVMQKLFNVLFASFNNVLTKLRKHY